MPTQEIDLYKNLQNPIDAIDRLGEWFAKSGMFGCEKSEQGKILAMAALTEHKSPIQIAREYHLIDGHLSDRADAMLAKFRAHGGKFRILERTSEVCSIELTHEGNTVTSRATFDELQAEPFVWSNKTDAKGKRLLKHNWATPRARMQTMWARVVSDGVRTLAPEIVAGIYTPEEIVDEPAVMAGPAPDVKPLFKEKPAKETKPEPPTIDVPSEPVAPPPTEAPKAEPAPALLATAEANPTTGALTPATVQAMMAVIGETNIVSAGDWMLKRGWLKEGQTLSSLSVQRAQRILDHPDEFVKFVKGGK